MIKKLTTEIVMDSVNYMLGLLEKAGLPEKFIDIRFYDNGQYCDVLTLRRHLIHCYTFYAIDINYDNSVSYRDYKILR